MKEIREEIKREVTDIHTYYEAADGTRFENQEECKKYEETAKCIIRSKAMKLVVAKNKNAWKLMGGSDDDTVTAFKMEKLEDLDTTKLFWLMECPWYNSEGRKELREQKLSIMDTAYQNGDILLFGQSCDDDYYFINSRQNIIDNLMNLDKEEKKDA